MKILDGQPTFLTRNIFKIQNCKFNYLIFLLYLFLSNFLFTVALNSDNLNPFINKYDKINYDTKTVNNRHTRVRRSIDDYLFFSFNAHGREFKLKLFPTNQHTYASPLVEINSNLNEQDIYKYINFYNGHLIDETESSYVSGSIIDGAFYGIINSKKYGKYFIEPSKKYNLTLGAHSIIYHEKDVNLNRTKLKQFKRSIEFQKALLNSRNELENNLKEDEERVDTGCASSKDKIKDWMKREQEALYNERVKQRGVDPYSLDDLEYDGYYKYSREANEKYQKREKKNKRELNEPERLRFPGERTICNLYLRVDPQLHTEIFNNEGNRDPDKTTTFLLFYLNKHVEALNSIYNSLPFFDQSKEKYLIGLQFMIYRTKIITEAQCRNKTVLSAEEQKLCEPYLDVSSFLNYVSLDNFTDYCLSYTFTARDFTDGTLGLAWVAKLSGSVGGVCEKRQTLQGIAKSLNSGIVTVVNYQTRVPEAVSQITFAHEVGHNFGSEHDPDDSVCSPGTNKGGNYIMYRRATTGNDKNNRNFSQCSRDQMGPIVHALISGPKFCFKQYTGSLCGNGIVEEGEECDCGYGTDCKESCCVDASQDLNKCKLKPGKACSPSQGPCCDNMCNFASQNTVCMHNNECSNDVYCTGKNATCPRTNPVFFKPDKTECNSGTQVCKAGICSGSICEKYEMEQCFIQGDLKDKKQDKSILCHLACIGQKTDYKCIDSFEIPEMMKPNTTRGLVLKPGSPCVGTLGYCDIFSKCRAVDGEGPLARLKNIILNPKTLSTIRLWITTYWWAASLIVVGLIVFMAIFIKVCSVHTPSSNPQKPPALKITDTLRRPIKKIPHPHWPHHHSNHQSGHSSSNLNAVSSKPKGYQKSVLVNEKNPKSNHRSKNGNSHSNEPSSSAHASKGGLKLVKVSKDPLASREESKDKRHVKRHKSNEPNSSRDNHQLHLLNKDSHDKKNRSRSAEHSTHHSHVHRAERTKLHKKQQSSHENDIVDKKQKTKSVSPVKHSKKSEFMTKTPTSNKEYRYKFRKRSSTESSSIDP